MFVLVSITIAYVIAVSPSRPHVEIINAWIVSAILLHVPRQDYRHGVLF